MRDVLQRAHIGLGPRGAAADQQDRHPRQRRVGHAGDGVGDAGAGSDHRHAEVAGQLGVRLGHVHGGAFVTHVDDTDAAAAEMVPDRLDVAALDAEDAVDATGDEEAGDPGGAAQLVLVQVDGLGHGSRPSSAAVEPGLEDAVLDLAGGGARHVHVAARKLHERGRL